MTTTVDPMSHNADLGLIGLAVMGRNLALNIADHGFAVAVYNRSPERTDEFLAGEASEASIIGVHSAEDLVVALQRPRIIDVDPGKLFHPPPGGEDKTEGRQGRHHAEAQPSEAPQLQAEQGAKPGPEEPGDQGEHDRQRARVKGLSLIHI